NSTTEPLVIISGDLGSGKTTILRRIFYEQADRRLSNPLARFPVFVRLGRLLRYSTLWEFLSSTLKEEQYISPPREVFERQLHEGRLVLLLDGFDEIHTGATADDRANYLYRLAPLLTSASPCIISTRPTYFESLSEMVGLFVGMQVNSPSLERISERPDDIRR